MVDASTEADMHETIVHMRQGRPEDADAIRALTRDAYARWVPMIGREPLPMTADFATAVRDHRFDLLWLGNTMAGLIETVAKADHLLIENVAVSPAFQGRGFGRLLLDRGEELAAASGHGEIRLYTNKLFAQNISLYQKRGYKIDREETWAGGVIVHMAKRFGDEPRWLGHSTA